jgi:selenocysteine lyase/cysteine desulfurase
MLSRRTLLAGATLSGLAASRSASARPTAPAVPPLDRVKDEAWWGPIQEAWTLDRTVINLNNGGVSPTPRVVHEALVRYLDLSNTAPAYAMWQLVEPGIESVRRELAKEAGCDAEELAIVRNASEALQIAQCGLDLQPGDEVVTSDQDYPRMLDTWEQLAKRRGIVVKKISFPVPPTDDIVISRFSEAIGPKTKVIHFCHITNLTGAILPAKQLCSLAREKGIVSIVDGAHAFAHFPYQLHDIAPDYYGTSLHKWLSAPVGTGFLYVRKERIAGHWGLQPTNPSRDADIRKFEEIGTHPAANHDAIAEALAFHRTMGGPLKTARLQYLRSIWTEGLRSIPSVRFNTSDDPARSGAIGNFSVEGMEPGKIVTALWDKYRIMATPIVHPQFQGVRVTPNVYTTMRELEVFVDAIHALVPA